MSKKIVAAVVTVVLLLACTAMVVPQGAVEKDLSKDLIRFHVIANSDSDQDQALKREVRDAILHKVGDRFGKAETVEDARNIVLNSLEDIEAAAREEIALEGREYPVKAQMGHFDFPAKSYGSFTLPEGNYEAVKVVIGEGKGANWWCVLFPPLCFVDISNSITTQPEVTKVSKNLEKSEAVEVTEDASSYEGEAEPVIQFKFKLLEVFDFSRDFIAGIYPPETD